MSRENRVNLAIMAVFLAGPLTAHALGDPYTVTLATKAAILALAGVGLNFALGLGGMISLGHAAFFGIGGYVCGILASGAATGVGTTQMLVIWPVAILASGVAAFAIGALSLRTSGVYFIMVTLAFAQMIYYFAISWPAYGGEDGLSFYVRNRFPGANTFSPVQYFGICVGLLLAGVGFSATLSASHFGLALRAVRQAPLRVVSVGIRPNAVRLTAFVISGAITGLAGALYADLNRFVSPAMLSWQMSGEIMVLVILGGAGRLMAPVVGASIYVLLEHVLGGLSDHWQFFLGMLLLLMVLFARGGIIGILAGRTDHG